MEHDSLLKKIVAIAHVNNEIIQRINNQKIISSCNKKQNLVAITDIFNDKLDYNCSSFADAARLNESMLFVAQKYKLFGRSEESKQELLKFKNNFEILQTFLGQIEEQMIDAKGNKQDIQKEVEFINKKIQDLLKRDDVKLREKVEFVMSSSIFNGGFSFPEISK